MFKNKLEKVTEAEVDKKKQNQWQEEEASHTQRLLLYVTEAYGRDEYSY